MFGYVIGFIPPVAWFVQNYIDLILLAAVGGTALVTLWHYLSERRKVRRSARPVSSPRRSNPSTTTGRPDQALFFASTSPISSPSTSDRMPSSPASRRHRRSRRAPRDCARRWP